MTKTGVALLFTLLLSLPGVAQNKAAAGDGEFRDLIRQYYAAWGSANPNNAAPLYAKEADLIFYDIAPLKYTGWEEYKQGVQKNLFDSMASGTLTPHDDLKINRRGNLAWTTVTGHFSAKMKDGKSMETDFRHTAIWEKRGGKWLIVHEHFSAPMQ